MFKGLSLHPVSVSMELYPITEAPLCCQAMGASLWYHIPDVPLCCQHTGASLRYRITKLMKTSVSETPQNGGISARNNTKWRHRCPKHHKMEASAPEKPQNGGIAARNNTKWRHPCSKHHKMEISVPEAPQNEHGLYLH